jgi:ABC-type nickel/cobalt efflux system permease component RcnA
VASCVHTQPEAPGAPALELLSRGLLAAIGAWLLFRAIRGEPHRHDACPWDLWRVSYRARLTLFAMVYALANGVPPAGVAFAAAMLLGVALTPCVVALLTIFAREWRVRSWTRHGATLAHLSRLLEGATGVALLLIGLAPFVSVI